MRSISLVVQPMLLAMLAFSTVPSTTAATFEARCDDEARATGGCSILMTGKIEKGDRDRLLRVLRTPLKDSHFFRTLLLNSPGGEVQEALLLSDIVVRAALDTSTYSLSVPEFKPLSAICVSACFLVWVAGAERNQASFAFAVKRGQHGIGLHRPFFAADQYAQLDANTAAQRQQELFAKIRAYLRRFDIPDAMVDEMMKRSSQEILWLSAREDPFVLSARAPWFEELMIARCKFDPVYAREAEAVGVKEIVGNERKSLATQRYFAWRQSYNSCEYAFRRASQKNLANSK